MSEKEPASGDVIPVFATVQRGSVQRAAHPDYKGPLPVDDEEDEILSQVGSAWRREDGTYVIQLVVFPVTGQLLLRLDKPYQPETGK
jgi:hypothetical protein